MDKLLDLFFQKFHHAPTVLASAPGRLEILGNHTDYNEGVVLSCAVTQRTCAAMRANDSRQAAIYDMRADSWSYFALDNLSNKLRPRWANYPAGVVSELYRRNFKVSGFEAVIDSTVPLSAGMSSSAAFETAILFGLIELNKLDIAPVEAALIGQGVENNFLGVQTGLLDQFSSIFGQSNAFILSDFRTNEVIKSVPVHGEYSIVVVNSMEKHNLVDSEYNLRRAACNAAAAKISARHPQIKTLRDVSDDLLESCRNLLSDTEYCCAKHIVGECKRVYQAVDLLAKDQIPQFGQLWWDSHESSRKNFLNSTPALDKLVEFSHQLPGALGARLSGGGFGGISIHLVENNAVENYRQNITALYENYCAKTPEIITCQPGAGAEAVKL